MHCSLAMRWRLTLVIVETRRDAVASQPCNKLVTKAVGNGVGDPWTRPPQAKGDDVVQQCDRRCSRAVRLSRCSRMPDCCQSPRHTRQQSSPTQLMWSDAEETIPQLSPRHVLVTTAFTTACTSHRYLPPLQSRPGCPQPAQRSDHWRPCVVCLWRQRLYFSVRSTWFRTVQFFISRRIVVSRWLECGWYVFGRGAQHRGSPR